MPEVIVIARPQIALYKDTSNGVKVVTSSFRRPSADSVSPSIKSLNYVNNVLARMEASDRGADEALLLDNNGFVAEASADNIFIVTPTGLATPPIATNLNGITRETVMELASEMDVPCEVRFFNLYEVWTAREVFICGTGAEIVPVLSVDGRAIGDWRNRANYSPVHQGIPPARAIDGHANRGRAVGRHGPGRAHRPARTFPVAHPVSQPRRGLRRPSIRDCIQRNERTRFSHGE